MLWPNVGPDNYGQPLAGDPVDLTVRWTEVESNSGTAQNNDILIDVTVVLDRKIPLGSYMMLGDLKDLPVGARPPTTDVFFVKTCTGSPDIKGRTFAWNAGLIRHKDV